jgi:hypothetical protein
MALGGGSQSVTASAVALSTAINGVVRAKSITFLNKVGNTGNITVGKSTVQADGHPGLFTIKPEASFTMTAPDGDFDSRLEVDFRQLYVIGTVVGDILQISFVD